MNSRRPLLVALAATAALSTAATASAQRADEPRAHASTLTELGANAAQPRPSCPELPNCSVLTRTTGFPARTGDVSRPLTARRDGRVVAFTVRLSRPTAEQIAFFNRTYGGPSRARISVLRPVRSRRNRNGTIRRVPRNTYQVNGQSEWFELPEYFGQRAQFAFERTLTVRKGWIVALTTNTWAPVLAVGQNQETAWRASRDGDKCRSEQRADFAQIQTAMRRTERRQFACLYTGAQLTYTATQISTP